MFWYGVNINCPDVSLADFPPMFSVDLAGVSVIIVSPDATK
ncbi:unnamed protein product [marine sediment metagenome]|uniref:Uncharacterized protein n=1 Tax=marine sediment metagenome TaxID=412755 RepID=X1CIR8_9ZZZZ